MSILNAIPVQRKDVAAIVRATFPGYKGRKIRIVVQDSVTLIDLNWSGGTRCQYRACTLAGEPLGNTDRFAAMAPWVNPAEGITLPIAPGACVVEHSIFLGKDAGLRIYIHPSDRPALLPTATTE
jgi:hypothetical protein